MNNKLLKSLRLYGNKLKDMLSELRNIESNLKEYSVFQKTNLKKNSSYIDDDEKDNLCNNISIFNNASNALSDATDILDMVHDDILKVLGEDNIGDDDTEEEEDTDIDFAADGEEEEFDIDDELIPDEEEYEEDDSEDFKDLSVLNADDDDIQDLYDYLYELDVEDNPAQLAYKTVESDVLMSFLRDEYPVEYKFLTRNFVINDFDTGDEFYEYVDKALSKILDNPDDVIQEKLDVFINNSLSLKNYYLRLLCKRMIRLSASDIYYFLGDKAQYYYTDNQEILREMMSKYENGENVEPIQRGVSGLCVYLPEGGFIQGVSGIDTYIKAIEKMGVKKVEKLHYTHRGIELIQNDWDDKYSKYQKELSNGKFLYYPTSTVEKKNLINKLSDALGLDWRAEEIP